MEPAALLHAGPARGVSPGASPGAMVPTGPGWWSLVTRHPRLRPGALSGEHARPESRHPCPGGSASRPGRRPGRTPAGCRVPRSRVAARAADLAPPHRSQTGLLSPVYQPPGELGRVPWFVGVLLRLLGAEQTPHRLGPPHPPPPGPPRLRDGGIPPLGGCGARSTPAVTAPQSREPYGRGCGRIELPLAPFREYLRLSTHAGFSCAPRAFGGTLLAHCLEAIAHRLHGHNPRVGECARPYSP